MVDDKELRERGRLRVLPWARAQSLLFFALTTKTSQTSSLLLCCSFFLLRAELCATNTAALYFRGWRNETAKSRPPIQKQKFINTLLGSFWLFISWGNQDLGKPLPALLSFL